MNTTTMILPALGLGLFASLGGGQSQEPVECAQAARAVRATTAPRAQSAEPTPSVAARSLVRFLGQQEVSTKVTTRSTECQEPSADAETVVLYPEDPPLLVQGVRSGSLPARVSVQAKGRAPTALAELDPVTTVQVLGEYQDLALLQEQMAGLRPNHSRYRVLENMVQGHLARQQDQADTQSRAGNVLRQEDQRAADFDRTRAQYEQQVLAEYRALAKRQQSAENRLNVPPSQEDARTRRLEARIEALERRLAERDARQTRASALSPRSRFGFFEQPEAEEVEPREEPLFRQPRPAPAPPRAPNVTLWRRAPDAPDGPDGPDGPDFVPAPSLPFSQSRASRAEPAPLPGRVQSWTARTQNSNQSVDLGELSELLREMREQVSDLRQDLRSLRNDLRQLNGPGLR